MLIYIISSKRELQFIEFSRFDYRIFFLKVIHGNSEYTLRNNIYACTLDTFFLYLSSLNDKYNLNDKENIIARSIII